MLSQGISPSRSGLGRRLHRLLWSARKRVVPDRQVVIPFDNGAKLKVYGRDRLGKRVYLDGYSDRALAVLLDAYLHLGMVYVDVGAHFGQFVLLASRRVGANGRVHAFEPASATYEQLQENIRLNGFVNIVANLNAVYEKSGVLDLHVCEPGLGEFNTLGRPSKRGGAIICDESVTAVTIDEYVSFHKISRVDLMKIDVEGAELHVLRGAESLLQRPDAPALIVEFNANNFASMGYGVPDIREKLRSLGYRLYVFEPETLALSEEPSDARYRKMVNIVAVKEPGRFYDTVKNRLHI